MARVARATLICRAEMLHSSTHPDETHVITRLATAESILTASGGQSRHPSAGQCANLSRDWTESLSTCRFRNMLIIAKSPLLLGLRARKRAQLSD